MFITKRRTVALMALLCLVLMLFSACVFSKKADVNSVDSSAEDIGNTEIAVHFLDVGQADSTLVLCGGKAMLIDGGNVEDSSFIYTYLKERGVNHIDYMVATHAHEDHVGGLAGALSYATVGTVLCPVTQYESDAFESFAKRVAARGASITVPKVGQGFTLGGAKVTVLACNSTEDTNNSSIILRITHGETSFLFTGDAEYDAEQAVLETGTDLGSTVLKVGHHGSDTSTSYMFLREVMPTYAVISVGKDNTYGHPTDTVLSRLRDAEVSVYRTDINGTVVCKGDGKNLSFTVEKNGQQTDNTNGQYILNTNSRKFHLPSCESAKSISAANKDTYSGTRQALVDKGYSPCGVCKP